MSFIESPPHSYQWSMISTCSTTLQHTYLKHTWNSSLICCMPHHGPPHIEKEIHSVVNGGRLGDTSGSCVPPEWTCCRVCAFLLLSLSTFQPSIFRGVGALSVIALKPTQPLVLFSCQQSQLTQEDASFPALHLCYFCKGTTPSPFLKCARRLHNGSEWKRLSTADYSIIALQRITKAFFQTLTAQSSLQHTNEAYFAMWNCCFTSLNTEYYHI